MIRYCSMNDHDEVLWSPRKSRQSPLSPLTPLPETPFQTHVVQRSNQVNLLSSSLNSCLIRRTCYRPMLLTSATHQILSQSNPIIQLRLPSQVEHTAKVNSRSRPQARFLSCWPRNSHPIQIQCPAPIQIHIPMPPQQWLLRPTLDLPHPKSRPYSSPQRQEPLLL